MNFLRLIIVSLTLLGSFTAFANEPCPKIDIPQEHKVSLSIEQQSLEKSEHWTIQSAFAVKKSVAESFDRTKQFERLEQIIPLINIFNLSEDRKTLEVGIKLLPGLSFRQTFQIAVNDVNKTIQLQFIEGSFAGLTGHVCFLNYNIQHTAIVMTATGNLISNPVPFFVTNNLLEALGKSLIRRWRNDIEKQ